MSGAGGGIPNSLKTFLEKNDLCDTVEIIDFSDDVPAILSKASYMLMPSLTEGFPLAALEAQCMKTFVFASDRIPRDVDIGYAQFISIDVGSENWAKIINEFIISKKITEYHIDEERKQQFDVRNIANRILYDYYLKSV